MFQNSSPVEMLAAQPAIVKILWATDGMVQHRRDDGGAITAQGFKPNKERAALYDLSTRVLASGQKLALFVERPQPQFPGDPLPSMLEVYDPAVHTYVSELCGRRAQQAEQDVATARREVSSHSKQGAHAGALDAAGKLPGKR